MFLGAVAIGICIWNRLTRLLSLHSHYPKLNIEVHSTVPQNLVQTKQKKGLWPYTTKCTHHFWRPLTNTNMIIHFTWFLECTTAMRVLMSYLKDGYPWNLTHYLRGKQNKLTYSPYSLVPRPLPPFNVKFYMGVAWGRGYIQPLQRIIYDDVW